MPAPSIWTPALIAELTRLWNVEKLPANEIARRLELSRNQVIGKARRLGLDARESPINFSGRKRQRVIAAEMAPVVKVAATLPAPAVIRAKSRGRPALMERVTQASREARQHGNLKHHIAPGYDARPITGGCRWIEAKNAGDEIRAGKKFDEIICGKPIAHPGGSYCVDHHARCWTKASQRPGSANRKLSDKQLAHYAKLRRAGWGDEAAAVEAGREG